MSVVRPYAVGQKVIVRYVDSVVGECSAVAYVTLVHQLAGGLWEVVARTGENRTLSFTVGSGGCHARLAPAARLFPASSVAA